MEVFSLFTIKANLRSLIRSSLRNLRSKILFNFIKISTIAINKYLFINKCNDKYGQILNFWISWKVPVYFWTQKLFRHYSVGTAKNLWYCNCKPLLTKINYSYTVIFNFLPTQSWWFDWKVLIKQKSYESSMLTFFH